MLKKIYLYFFPPKPSPNKIVPARIAIMITRDVRQQLYEMRYTKIQVDAMTPSEAQDILEKYNK